MADFSSSGRLPKNYGSNLRQSEGKLYPDLEQKLSGEPDFQVAIWLCTEEEEDDCRVAEELSRCASEILLIADAGVDVANRRSEAELPPKVLLFIVRVALPLNWPWLSMPPPMPVEPFVIVRSEIVTVRPKSSIRNTRLAWLASMQSPMLGKFCENFGQQISEKNTERNKQMKTPIRFLFTLLCAATLSVQTVHAATFVVIASNLKLSVYACRTP